MRFLSIFSCLFILTCSVSNPSSVNRKGFDGLPRNPDPNKCYVRAVTLDEYAEATYSSLTYSQEEAKMYNHERRLLEIQPAMKGWEYTTYDNCESEDPNDCKVLCYRNYEAVYDTFYYPVDSTLGNPFVRKRDFRYIVSKGGLTTYEEIDCRYTSFTALPFLSTKSDEKFFPEDIEIIEKELVSFLKENPNLSIEIAAHTDARGDTETNILLSTKRAKAIVNVLLVHGINRSRIVARSFGESRLKNKCSDGVECSETEHAVNDRIEWKVLNQNM